MNPTEKMYMKYKKEWLVFKAREMCLSDKGTKRDLAIRITEREKEIFSKNWQTISNGRVTEW